MKRHPIRWLFERLGLVRTPEELEHRFERADRVAAEGIETAKEAKERRMRLAYEAQSHRRKR